MKTEEKSPAVVPKVKVAVLGTENVGKSGKFFLKIVCFIVGVFEDAGNGSYCWNTWEVGKLYQK